MSSRGLAAASPGREEAPGPGRQRITFSNAAEGVDKPRESAPSKASQLAGFESTDHGLVDVAELRELPLRQAEPLASSPDEAADPGEATDRRDVLGTDFERVPWHGPMMTTLAYRELHVPRSRTVAGDDLPEAMPLGCIAAGSHAVAVACIPGLMHVGCIAAAMRAVGAGAIERDLR